MRFHFIESMEGDFVGRGDVTTPAPGLAIVVREKSNSDEGEDTFESRGDVIIVSTLHDKTRQVTVRYTTPLLSDMSTGVSDSN